MPVGSKDFAAYIRSIRDAELHAIMVFLTVYGVAFMKAWYATGGAQTRIKILATGDLVKESSFPALGDAAGGIVSATNHVVDRKSPVNQAFQRDMHAADPAAGVADFFTAATYDVMQATYPVTAKQNDNIDPDKTMTLLKGMKLQGPRGPIQIDAQTREGTQNTYIQRTEKGPNGYANVEIAAYPAVRDALEK